MVWIVFAHNCWLHSPFLKPLFLETANWKCVCTAKLSHSAVLLASKSLHSLIISSNHFNFFMRKTHCCWFLWEHIIIHWKLRRVWYFLFCCVYFFFLLFSSRRFILLAIFRLTFKENFHLKWQHRHLYEFINNSVFDQCINSKECLDPSGTLFKNKHVRTYCTPYESVNGDE